MKAYVARNKSGAVTKGWLLKQGTSIDSSMCRLQRVPADERIEEVSVEAAVRGAALRTAGGRTVGPARSRSNR